VSEYCNNNNNVKILYSCSKGEATLNIVDNNSIIQENVYYYLDDINSVTTGNYWGYDGNVIKTVS
jgi:hypothetical protein